MLIEALPLDLTLIQPPYSGAKAAGDIFEIYLGALVRQIGGYHEARWFLFLSFWRLAGVGLHAIRQFQ